MILRLLGGAEVTADAVMNEVTARVGFDGHFLGQKETSRRLRAGEVFLPEIASTSLGGGLGERGSRRAGQGARARTRDRRGRRRARTGAAGGDERGAARHRRDAWRSRARAGRRADGGVGHDTGRRTMSSERAAVPPVGARSWWLEEALRADPGAPCPPLAGEVTADVCVVGGGFAGLWTAYELARARPRPRASSSSRPTSCGAGGSGANGGFFSPSWTQLSSLCASLGEEGGVATPPPSPPWSTSSTGGSRATTRASTPGTRASCTRGPATGSRGPDDETFRLLEKHGYADRLRRVDAAEARSVADSPRFVGGVVTPDLTVLQPGKLARELRRVLLERGVRIFEGTPDGARRGRPAAARGDAGRRRDAPAAWCSRTAPGRRGSGTSAAPSPSAPTSWSSPSRSRSSSSGSAGRRTWASPTCARCCYYLRRTADDRIAIGGGAMGIVYGARIRGRVLTAPRLAAVAAHGLTWLFPQLEGVRFDAAWSGPMDITGAALPFFESAPGGNVHAGLGFSGHGLTSTKLGGKILASLVLRADDEWSRLPVVGPPLSQLPPEPVRWPLVQSVTWAYEASDRAHERGRRPGLLPRAVVAEARPAEQRDRRLTVCAVGCAVVPRGRGRVVESASAASRRIGSVLQTDGIGEIE